MKQHYDLVPFNEDNNLKISCDMELTKDEIILDFEMRGDLSQIEIARWSREPQRRYDIWEETCFEFFLKERGVPHYIEFNFAPSGDWNSFYMTEYRNNVGELQSVKWALVQILRSGRLLGLRAKIRLDQLDNYSFEKISSGKCLVGLTAVVKNSLEEMNYFALHHPLETPDFHHEGGFKPFADQN